MCALRSTEALNPTHVTPRCFYPGIRDPIVLFYHRPHHPYTPKFAATTTFPWRTATSAAAIAPVPARAPALTSGGAAAAGRTTTAPPWRAGSASSAGWCTLRTSHASRWVAGGLRRRRRAAAMPVEAGRGAGPVFGPHPYPLRRCASRRPGGTCSAGGTSQERCSCGSSITATPARWGLGWVF